MAKPVKLKVRHRIASFSQQSQRFADLSKKEVTYIILPKYLIVRKKTEFQKTMERIGEDYRNLIKNGVAPEDARFVLSKIGVWLVV